MAVLAGEALIKLGFDGKSLQASANKIEPQVKGVTSKLVGGAKTAGKAIGVALGAGYIATSTVIGKTLGDAVNLYGEFEQLSGGIESMFGGAEKGAAQIDKVNQLANESWKNLTLSQNEYYKSFSSTYPLMKADIKDQNQAIEATNRLMTLNSDLANTFGYDMETAATAVNWALKGNYSYLDNLNIGIKGTKSGFLEAAHNAGYMVKSVDELKSEDILTILEKQAGKFGVLGKTAKEAGGTIQGSMKMAKSAYENLLTGLADPNADLGKLIDNLVSSIFGDGSDENKGLVGNLLPAIERAIGGIAKALPKLVTSIAKELPKVLKALIPALVQATVAVFVALADVLPEMMPIIVDGLVDLVIALVPQIPVILMALFNAIIASVVSLFAKISEIVGPWLSSVLEGMLNAIGNWFMGIGESINTFFGDFAQKAVDFIDRFVQGFKQGIENIKNFFASIPGFFAGVVGKITEKVKQFGMKVGEVVGGAFKAVVNGVLRFIENFINAPIRAINGLIDTINNVPGIDLGRLNEFHLPRLAKGGLVTGSTLANIGEAGSEAVIPLERNTENWARPLASAIADQFKEQGIGGAGVTVCMTNNINNNLDADEIGRRLMTSIRRAA